MSTRHRVTTAALVGGLLLASVALVALPAAALGSGNRGAGAAPPAGSGPDASQARVQARHILAGGRFKTRSLPDPLRGVKKRIGDWLRDTFGNSTPRRGGIVVHGQRSMKPVFWVVVTLAVLALAILASVLIARRRSRDEDEEDHAPDTLDAINDADRLERMADDAERAGALEAAIRYRFRAGLLRLDRAGAIELRPSITTGQVARRVRMPTFDDVASTFDAVAYGGRVPARPDVDAARRGWSRVLTEVKSR